MGKGIVNKLTFILFIYHTFSGFSPTVTFSNHTILNSHLHSITNTLHLFLLFSCSRVLSFSRSLVLSFSRSLVLSFSRSLVLSFSCSLILLFTHSLVLSFSRALVLSCSRSLVLSCSRSLILPLFFSTQSICTCLSFLYKANNLNHNHQRIN